MTKRSTYLFALFCYTLTLAAQGPGMSLRWHTSTDTVLIGAPLAARLEAILLDSLPPQWETAIAGLSPFEVWQQDTLPVSELGGDSYRHALQLIIVSFDEGEHRIGPLVLARGEDTLYSNLLTLAVTIIPVDTSGDIRPIAPPMDASLTWLDWLWRILAVLAALALIAGALYWWKKWRDRKKRQTPPVLDKPVREWALLELEQLAQALPATQPQAIKSYYDKLSYIMRVFMHYQYGIPALELTSREIARWTKGVAGYEQWEPVMLPVLQEADLAKFAKATPGEERQRHAFDTVKKWVGDASPENSHQP